MGVLLVSTVHFGLTVFGGGIYDAGCYGGEGKGRGFAG